MAHTNENMTFADNPATRALAVEIVILRAVVNAMIETSRRREALLEHYKELLEGFADEVMR